jgi:hypothetical protein
MTSWTLKQVQGDEAGQSCAVTDWERALARLRKAQVVLDAAKSEPDQDAYDALLDSHSDALTAPNLPALAAKPCPERSRRACPERSRRIDAIVPSLAWELTGSEGCP